MKRTITLLLSLIMIASLLAGCGGNTDPTATPGESTAPPAGNTPTPDDSSSSIFPLAERAEFKIWYPNNIGTPWLQDNTTDVYTYGLLEKATNVHINWTIPAHDATTESFMLTIASQEYPDLFQSFTQQKTVSPAQAIEDEVCIMLTDVVDQYMPNYKRLISADPTWYKRAVADGGDIHVLFCVYSEVQAPWQGTLIRGDWLDDLGKDVPVTYDDLYDVLTVFKTEKNAFAPLLIDTRLSTDIASHWIGGFGVVMDFYVENAKTVKYGPIEPAFKDMLTLFTKWYSEGLIDPDFLSNDSGARWSKIFSGDGGAATGSTRNNGKLKIAEAAEPDKFYMTPMNNPRLNANDKAHFRTVASLFGATAMISTDCENVPLLAQWLDYCYSEEGYMLLNFGEEGVTFYYDENGVPTIDIEGFNTLMGTTDGAGDDFVSRSGHNMKPSEAPFLRAMYKGLNEPNLSTGPQVERSEAAMLWLNGDADDWKWDTYNSSISISLDEANEANNIIADISTLVEEHAARIITGLESLDEWDSVVDQVISMIIARVIEIRQGAIDRFNAR